MAFRVLADWEPIPDIRSVTVPVASGVAWSPDGIPWPVEPGTSAVIFVHNGLAWDCVDVIRDKIEQRKSNWRKEGL